MNTRRGFIGLLSALAAAPLALLLPKRLNSLALVPETGRQKVPIGMHWRHPLGKSVKVYWLSEETGVWHEWNHCRWVNPATGKAKSSFAPGLDPHESYLVELQPHPEPWEVEAFDAWAMLQERGGAEVWSFDHRGGKRVPFVCTAGAWERSLKLTGGIARL